MQTFNNLGSEVTDDDEFNTEMWKKIIIVRDSL